MFKKYISQCPNCGEPYLVSSMINKFCICCGRSLRKQGGEIKKKKTRITNTQLKKITNKGGKIK